eukprot:CAMPEP_0118910964 /NCGR_PEP_ID=MMETSP1166-20130328/12876_1 /TAXON_ID=1104430 /ORGANISM="Chrysoreinhardia sp, Strain CCMP3193" /LENGTH=43 /DNA_ID= /DNA_START= /DNA_END= /DNA_ORIENTATION=
MAVFDDWSGRDVDVEIRVGRLVDSELSRSEAKGGPRRALDVGR